MKAVQLILGILLAITLNIILTKPAYEAQPALKTEQAQVKAEYDSAEQKISQIPSLKSELAVREQALAEVQRNFPAHEEIGILVRSLQQAADQDQVTISEITRTTQPSPVPGFTEVQLGLTATGSFPNVYRFLDWAHDQPRILNVTTINSNSGTEHQINITSYTRSDEAFNAPAQGNVTEGGSNEASGAATAESEVTP